MTWSAGIAGNSAVSFGGNEDGGTWSVGIAADVRQRCRFDLKYVSFFGDYTKCPRKRLAPGGFLSDRLHGREQRRARGHFRSRLRRARRSRRLSDEEPHMIRKTLFTAILAVMSASTVRRRYPDEAAQLGKTLTPTGAEKAGNKDGTIPEWTGGLTTSPAGFKPGSTVRPDPYAGDKPRLVITGQNADQHKDKLTAATHAMLKRHATMRLDVYPTHRPVMFPERLVENTLKNATQAKTVEGGSRHRQRAAGHAVPHSEDGRGGDVESPAALQRRCHELQVRVLQHGRVGRHDAVDHGQQRPGIPDLQPGEPGQAHEGHGRIPEPESRVHRSGAPRRRGAADHRPRQPAAAASARRGNTCRASGA